MNELGLDYRHRELGTIENPIIDSQLTTKEALRPNPKFLFPREVFERQVLLPVVYLSFDGKYHEGQIVVDKDLEKDVRDFFEFLLLQNFPVNKAMPVAHAKFNFDDGLSMAENNSSGFNPRNKTEKDEPSNHAFGRAIDINPLLNPYISNNITEPKGALYNNELPGTFIKESEVVEFLKTRGWIWGGDYNSIKDYQHFEKPALKAEKLYTIEIFTDQDQQEEEFKRLGLEVSEEIGQPYADDWQHIRETYIDTGGIFYTVKIGGKIVGCAGVKKIDKDTAEFKRARIFEEYRGGGIGRELFDKCLSFVKQNGFKKVSLDTINPIVKGLCEENGFVITEIDKPKGKVWYCEKDLTS